MFLQHISTYFQQSYYHKILLRTLGFIIHIIFLFKIKVKYINNESTCIILYELNLKYIFKAKKLKTEVEK